MNIILTTYKKLKVTTRKNLEELFKSADVSFFIPIYDIIYII